MLLNADFKSLEVVCAAYLSQDKVMCEEVRNRFDFHADNQTRFKLPERVLAKALMFRIIYGGTQFSKDPAFQHVSRSQKFWDKIIEDFYAKYKGLHSWHTDLMREATTTGCIQIPTGRVYNFSSNMGDWPRTQILNYPVQGLAADLVSIARVSLRRRLLQTFGSLQARELLPLIVGTIHDSIILDCPNDKELIQQCLIIMEQVVIDVPKNFGRLFKVSFNLPLEGEYSYGSNKKDLIVWKKNGPIKKE